MVLDHWWSRETSEVSSVGQGVGFDETKIVLLDQNTWKNQPTGLSVMRILPWALRGFGEADGLFFPVLLAGLIRDLARKFGHLLLHAFPPQCTCNKSIAHKSMPLYNRFGVSGLNMCFYIHINRHTHTHKLIFIYLFIFLPDRNVTC